MTAPDLSWICPSCGSTTTTRYCGSCGEERVGFLASVSDRKTKTRRSYPFLARVHASLRALASPPGKLTADWIRGKRVGYLSPLSLFLWVNVAFFLVQSASGVGILTWPLRVHLSDESFAWLTTRLLAHHRNVGPSSDTYAEVFNALEAVHAKSLVIVMIPAFALVLAAVMRKPRVPFKHLATFATHFFSFALIWLCALFALVAIVLRLGGARHVTAPWLHSMDLLVSGLEAAVFGWYLYVALGTVFGLPKSRRLVTAFALVAGLYGILKAYHVGVFAVTLYST